MLRLQVERFLVRWLLPLLFYLAISILVLRQALLFGAEGIRLLGAHIHVLQATDCAPRFDDGEVDDSCRWPFFGADWTMWLALGVGLGLFAGRQYWGLYRKPIRD